MSPRPARAHIAVCACLFVLDIHCTCPNCWVIIRCTGVLQLHGYPGHEFNKIHSVTSQASVDIVERDIVYTL